MKKKLRESSAVPPEKVTLISNWTSGVAYLPPTDEGDFLMLYSGNIGVAHDFTLLRPFVRRMKVIPGILYEFIGEGKRKREVARIFQNAGESRIVLKPYADKSEVSANLSRAGMVIVAQSRNTVGDILPSKLYSYLAAGRPLLFFGPRRSEIGEIIVKNDIGVVVETKKDVGRAADYAAAIKVDARLRKAVCARARYVYEKSYMFENSLRKFAGLIERAAGENAV